MADELPEIVTSHELILQHIERFGSCPWMGYSDEALEVLIPKALEEGKPIQPAGEYFGYGPDIII